MQSDRHTNKQADIVNSSLLEAPFPHHGKGWIMHVTRKATTTTRFTSNHNINWRAASKVQRILHTKMKLCVTFKPTVLGTVALMRRLASVVSLAVVCTECIVAIWCVLEQKLLLTAYKKSYEKSIGTKMNDFHLCLEVVSRSYRPLRYIRYLYIPDRVTYVTSSITWPFDPHRPFPIVVLWNQAIVREYVFTLLWKSKQEAKLSLG